MKKLLALVIASSIVFGLTACAAQTEETTEEASSATEVSGEDETAVSDEETYDYPVLELSGDASDTYNIDERSYYEGDRFVLYFDEGAVVHGNVADEISRIMDMNEELFGMSYDVNDYVHESDWREYYLGGDFQGINSDMSKLNIIITPDPNNGNVEWSNGNVMMIYDEDLERGHGSYDTLYHELAHMLRLRQSNYLGSIIEEGVALYAQTNLSRKDSYPDWSIIQYVDYGGYSSTYDQSAITNDPETEFKLTMSEDSGAEQKQYQYGIRFVTFLIETYGIDVIEEMGQISLDYDYEEHDAETICRIIKEATSDDVFIRFAEWLDSGWNDFGRDYVEYMNQFGLA
ncbi:MAG: hypothetical protein IKE53_06520 [Clostridiales bacterium]|nr:hypothetical protein [Clostridiales bacterium]